MDYDQTTLADNYNEVRSYKPQVEVFWQDTIKAAAAQCQIKSIVDLGCGTGRYTSILANSFEAHVTAIDPSQNMLDHTKAMPRVTYVNGCAENVPLADNTADMIFMSMVWHHIKDKEKALKECRRILRDDGIICLRAITADQIMKFPFTQYFPEAINILQDDLQTAQQLIVLFSDASFDCIDHQIFDSEVADNLGDFAKKIALRSYSTLEKLTNKAFNDGLEKLKSDVSRSDDTLPITEAVDFFVFRV